MVNDLQPAPPEIEMVVGRLISTYFPQLADARILLAVRETAEPSQEVDGQFSVAAAGAAMTETERAQFDYVVWVAWDVWQVLDDGDREALIFHELMHLGRDEQTGEPKLNGHDAGVFNDELDLYGKWWIDAQMKFRQLNKEQ